MGSGGRDRVSLQRFAHPRFRKAWVKLADEGKCNGWWGVSLGSVGGILLYNAIRNLHLMLEMCASLRSTIPTIPHHVAALVRFRGVNRRTDHIFTSAALVLTLRLDELQKLGHRKKQTKNILDSPKEKGQKHCFWCPFPLLPGPCAPLLLVKLPNLRLPAVSHCDFHQDSCSQSSPNSTPQMA